MSTDPRRPLILVMLSFPPSFQKGGGNRDTRETSMLSTRGSSSGVRLRLSRGQVEGINLAMPYDSDMNTLIFLAAEAGKEEEWHDFSRFCEFRGQGVRAAAMEHLNKFLQSTARWSLEKRLAFSKWALWRSRKFQNDRVVLPHPIRERLIVPTLRSWSEASPGEAEAHLWLGLLRCDDPSRHLDQALELDPSCALARQTLTDWIISDVEYNQHELPSFYINDPASDLEELDKASELAAGVTVEAWVRIRRKAIAELRTQALSWIATNNRAGNVVSFPDTRFRVIRPVEE